MPSSRHTISGQEHNFNFKDYSKIMLGIIRPQAVASSVDTKKITVRIFEAFAGIGVQSLALLVLSRIFKNFCFEVVGMCDIKTHAEIAYRLLHGSKIKNYGDITKIDWGAVPPFDVFTYSFPCQDISQSGNMAGMEEGSDTRSALIWQCKKAIEKHKPEFLIMENVKALTTKRFKSDVDKWVAFLDGEGYASKMSVINSRHLGSPQSRERTFMISYRGERKFNIPTRLEIPMCRPEDFLEKRVDMKYYLNWNVA